VGTALGTRVANQKALASWLYASRGVLPAAGGQTVVQQIVNVSRVKNDHLAITRALIFTGSFFAQYIEGPPDGVESLKASIWPMSGMPASAPSRRKPSRSASWRLVARLLGGVGGFRSPDQPLPTDGRDAEGRPY
jgi:hypothetical protein